MIKLIVKLLIILQVISAGKTHVPPVKPVGLNCKSYHNGVFRITISQKATIVKRFGSKQYDYYDGAKAPTGMFNVSWKDDCTFMLKPTKEMVKNNPASKDHILTVEIVQQNAHSFTQVVSANYTKAKINCEVEKID
jgi:hypothetical protein